MEKTTDPATGCPSSEMTRQLRICVPRPRSAGAAISTVPSLSSNRSSALRGAVRPDQRGDKRRDRLVEGQREGPRARRQPSRRPAVGSPRATRGAWAVTPSHIQASIMATASVRNGRTRPSSYLPLARKWLARRNAPAAIDQWPPAFSSSLMPGAGVSSSSSAWPAAGISIQRSTAPSGHSCTTGK